MSRENIEIVRQVYEALIVATGMRCTATTQRTPN